MAKKKPEVSGEVNVTNNIENATFNNIRTNDDKLEKLKQDLIERLKQKRFEYPHLVRAAGCQSSRDYLDGHIEELRQILWIHFGYKEEE